MEAVAEPESDNGDVVAAPAKKKTRRGSRGGRSRKKKPVAAGAAASDNGAEPVDTEAVETAPQASGDEYVPMSEWLDDIER